MPNNQADLRAALHTYLTADSNAFITAVGNRLFYHQAPGGEDLPYAVFDIFVSNEDRDSASKMYDHEVNILIGANNMTELENVMEKLLARLDDKEGSLTVAGYKVILIYKNFQSQPQLIEEVWQQGVNYSILLSQ